MVRTFLRAFLLAAPLLLALRFESTLKRWPFFGGMVLRH